MGYGRSSAGCPLLRLGMLPLGDQLPKWDSSPQTSLVFSPKTTTNKMHTF